MIPKFRAWDKANKKMCDVKAWSEFNGGEVTIKRDGENASYVVLLDDIILMQSTGMFDTNCLDELFDGDVIYWKYYDSDWSDSGKAQIIFKNGSWKLLDAKTNEEVWDNLYVCLENCNVFKKGNLYENPDLLESVEE